MIVVDTSVWVDFFRDSPTWQVDHLASLIEEDADVALTDIVLTEILQGVRSDRQAERLHEQLAAFDVLRLGTIEDFTRASGLYRKARAQGFTIRRTLDCLIASVCVREAAALLHARADFDHLARSTPLQVVPAPA